MMSEFLEGEVVETPRNPGTANNTERSGDRDLYFSWVLRQPTSPSHKCRSCDFDALPHLAPTIFCNKCSLPVLLIEATRAQGFKATRYTQAIARKLEIEAYLVRHSGVWGLSKDGSDRTPSPTFEVTRLSTGKVGVFQGEAEFIKWLEEKFEVHFQRCRIMP